MRAGGTGPTVREQLLAALVAALCGLLFLGPAVLPSHALLPFPPENLEPWRSEQPVGDLLYGQPSLGDKYNQSLAWDRITTDALREGRLPLWTRDIGGGAAFVPQMGQVYQPWTWLLLLLPAPRAYGLWFLLHQVVIGWLCYRFLRRLEVRHAAALLGVVAVVLGLWLQARVHHNVIVSAVLPLFGMLSCVHELFCRDGGRRTAGLLALGFGLCWLGGLPQASLMCTLLVLAWAAFCHAQTPSRPHARAWAWIAAGLLLGGLVGLAQMAPVLLAAGESARRSADEAWLLHRALEWDHLLGLLWPSLLHWPAERFYFGTIDTVRPSWAALLLLDAQRIQDGVYSWPETAAAIGLPATILALAGVDPRRRAVAWFFAGVVLAGILLATAAPPLFQLSAWLPGGRAGDAKRWLFLAGAGLPVLATFGADRWLERGLPRATWLAAAAVGIASAALWLVHLRPAADIESWFAEWTTRGTGFDARDFHAAVARGEGFDEAVNNRARLLATFGQAAAVAAATLVLLLQRRRALALALLTALNAVDLELAGLGPVCAIEVERVCRLPAVLEPVAAATRSATGERPRFQRLRAADDPRRSGLFPPNLGAFHGLEDLAAYNPLPPRRLEEFWNAIEPGIGFGGAGVNGFRDPATLGHPMLDVLGLRFVLAAHALDLPGLIERTPPSVHGPYRLYERPGTLPRATFVTRTRTVPDPGQRLVLLADRTRDAQAELLLEDPGAPAVEPPPPTSTPPAAAQVTLVRHADEHVVVDVTTPRAGYLRLADPYDPGWTATLDGAQTTLYCADHYLRAVHVPAGAHRIEFRFDAARVVWPPRVALLASLLIGGLLLGRRRVA